MESIGSWGASVLFRKKGPPLTNWTEEVLMNDQIKSSPEVNTGRSRLLPFPTVCHSLVLECHNKIVERGHFPPTLKQLLPEKSPKGKQSFQFRMILNKSWKNIGWFCYESHLRSSMLYQAVGCIHRFVCGPNHVCPCTEHNPPGVHVPVYWASSSPLLNLMGCECRAHILFSFEPPPPSTCKCLLNSTE